MPLPQKPRKGAGKKATQAYVSRVIRIEKAHGKPTRQAVAIALSAAGKSRKK